MAASLTNHASTEQLNDPPEQFILVVDDEPANLFLLQETLSLTGLEIRVATNGTKAIELTRKYLPTLILLDVLMPGIDGFETCRLLKAEPQTTSIPVIFATASSEVSQRVKGFSMGAVDYITKPFHVEEVLARVKVQLELQELAKTLRSKNHQLEKEIEARNLAEERLYKTNQRLGESLRELESTQVQLIQNEKMSSLGYLVSGIAHEINNPTNFIQGNLIPTQKYITDLMQLIALYQQYYPDGNPIISKVTQDIDLDFIKDDYPKLISSMQTGTKRIGEIIDSLKKFAYLDEANFKQINVHDGLENTLSLLSHRLMLEGGKTIISVEKNYGALPKVDCYPAQLNQVFMTILNNAIDVLEEVSSENNMGRGWIPTIRIQTHCTLKTVFIQIEDNGIGISKDLQNKIFEPFFTTKPTGKGTGLGLAIAHQIIVEQHGGQLDVTSALGQGTTMSICLPI
ncbi:MAG: response regulator [Symploca sp. SIO2B6]|nr:response regulator [Symploca sp. SIO2B6]